MRVCVYTVCVQIMHNMPADNTNIINIFCNIIKITILQRNYGKKADI